MNLPDDAINPSYYRSKAGLESIDVIEAFVPDKPYRWAAFKYLFRAGRKRPETEIEDLRKARWWIDREIAHLEREIVRLDMEARPRYEDCQQERCTMHHLDIPGSKE